MIPPNQNFSPSRPRATATMAWVTVTRLTLAMGFASGAWAGDQATLSNSAEHSAQLRDNAADRTIPDLKLELVWIKPGSFMMGSSADLAKNKAERPQVHVTITNGFWLGRTEVTQAQYEAVMNVNPSTFNSVGPNAPVERVSWADAMAFCTKLNERERAAGRIPEGFKYTLPTEAQWEYSCRAGTAGEYAGNQEAMAWYDENSGGTTHPVATKQPNAWGLYDMSGNVLEWCFDWYGDYPGGEVIDPTGPAHGYYRLARGGSWRAAMHVGRSASRAGGSPGRLDYTIGFRVALRSMK